MKPPKNHHAMGDSTIEPRASEALQEVLLARQPVYDRDFNVVAYELLFRHTDIEAHAVVDQDQATSQVLVNVFVELGSEALVGNHGLVLNVTRGFLTGDYPLPPATSQLVLDIGRDIRVDSQLVTAVRQLKAEGYKIALDSGASYPEVLDLLAIADILRIDVRAVAKENLRGHAASLRREGLKLLASKVETYEEFEFCRELGFELYQGFFLSRPRIVQGKALQHRQLGVLELLSKLHDPTVTIDEIETLLQKDVSASYKLLRYVNSVALGTSRKIDSIRRAIVLVGLQSVRTLVTLIAMGGIPGKPHALMITAMVRARMCEELGAALKAEEPRTYFVVGLFSVLDALLDCPMQEVLGSLPLSEEVNAALLDYQGLLGRALSTVLAYERAEWDQGALSGTDTGPDQERVLDSDQVDQRHVPTLGRLSWIVNGRTLRSFPPQTIRWGPWGHDDRAQRQSTGFRYRGYKVCPAAAHAHKGLPSACGIDLAADATTDPRQILVVTRDSSTVAQLRTVLAGSGVARFQVTDVQSLWEALDQLDGTRFDLVLLNPDLRDSQGMKTFTELSVRNREVPIILTRRSRRRVLGDRRGPPGRSGLLDCRGTGRKDGVSCHWLRPRTTKTPGAAARHPASGDHQPVGERHYARLQQPADRHWWRQLPFFSAA